MVLGPQTTTGTADVGLGGWLFIGVEARPGIQLWVLELAGGRFFSSLFSKFIFY